MHTRGLAPWRVWECQKRHGYSWKSSVSLPIRPIGITTLQAAAQALPHLPTQSCFLQGSGRCICTVRRGCFPQALGEDLTQCLAGDGWGLPNLGSRWCRAPAELSPCGCLSPARAETSQDQSLGCLASSLLPASGLLPNLIPHHIQACSTSLPSALWVHSLYKSTWGLMSSCLLIHWNSHSSELLGSVWAELLLDSRHLHFSFLPSCVSSSIFFFGKWAPTLLDAESTEWKRYTPTFIPANWELCRHRGGVLTGVCGTGMARKTSWMEGGPSDSSWVSKGTR